MRVMRWMKFCLGLRIIGAKKRADHMATEIEESNFQVTNSSSFISPSLKPQTVDFLATYRPLRPTRRAVPIPPMELYF